MGVEAGGGGGKISDEAKVTEWQQTRRGGRGIPKPKIWASESKRLRFGLVLPASTLCVSVKAHGFQRLLPAWELRRPQPQAWGRRGHTAAAGRPGSDARTANICTLCPRYVFWFQSGWSVAGGTSSWQHTEF